MGQTRLNKARYTSQDVREQALEARDELMANIEFFMDVIREDRFKLMKYRERFGDLQYRPLISPAQDGVEPIYGEATQTVLEPLVSQYKNTINSLFQSIRLIMSEILPEDDPEGDSARSQGLESPKKSTSLRESFLLEASQDKTPIQPSEPDDESATELVENAKPQPKAPQKPSIQPDKASPPKPNPKSWRDETPRATSKPEIKPQSISQNHPTTQPIDRVEKSETTTKNKSQPSATPQPQIGLSPALRMSLGMGSSNRLDSIRDKYKSGVSRIVKKSDSNENE